MNLIILGFQSVQENHVMVQEEFYCGPEEECGVSGLGFGYS